MHIPVLLETAVELWASLDKNRMVEPGIYVDATFGGGGHSKRLLDYPKKEKDIVIVGIDRDSNQFQSSNVKFQREIENKRLYLYNDSFRNIVEIISSFQKKYKIKLPIRGILFDFGISTNQLQAGRGFSFREEKALLDLRFSPDEKIPTAVDILNGWREEELVRIFQEYGEERYARKVAREIINERRQGKKIQKVADLLSILKKTLFRAYQRQKIHYATRVFQALRIAVNDEYGNIQQGLEGALKILEKGGRITAISFHSGEDRLVKNFFRRESRDCLCPPNVPSCVCGHQKSLQIITRKPLTPGPEEIERNPKVRSAKLRAAEKL